MDKKRKPFKDTAVGKFLLGRGGKAIIETIGDILPGGNVIKALIQKDDDVSDQDKTIALALLEAEKEEFDGITERWKSDTKYGSGFSSNIRPAILSLFTLAIVSLIFIDTFNVDLSVPEGWIDFLMWNYGVMITAYFGSRGVEKVKQMNK